MDKLLNGAHEALGLNVNWNFTLKNKEGRVKWEEKIDHNLIVDQGINHLLNVVFHGETPVSPWYLGLKGVGTVAATDTLASHAGWVENTAYTGNRKEFVEAESTEESITNSANKAVFVFTSDDQVIDGGFLASVDNGTAGILFSAVQFTKGPKSDIDIGDTLEVTYTITAGNMS